MKTALITNYWKNSDGGGVKTYLVNLVDAMEKKGADVSVLFWEGDDPEHFCGGKNKVAFSLACYRKLRKIRSEVIYSQGTWYCLLPGVLYKKPGFPMEKRLEDFDMSFQPSLDPAVIRDLASLRFIHNAENVVFLGPPGVGKTHLALALGYEAVRQGFRVYFANASHLMERLIKAKFENKLEERIKGLTKFHLLIVDEMGYLPFNSEGAHCFFNLISRRYEKSSTIFTSNKSYGEWGEIFGDHVIVAAVLDRILHHCTTLNIKGDSYRLKERRKQGVFTHSLPG